MFEVKVNPTDQEGRSYVVFNTGDNVKNLGQASHSDGHTTTLFKYVTPLEMRQAAAILLEEADRMTDVYRADLTAELDKFSKGVTPYDFRTEGSGR